MGSCQGLGEHEVVGLIGVAFEKGLDDVVDLIQCKTV